METSFAAPAPVPPPPQPIKDNEVILLHQQFSHPMDRGVAQLWLFLGDRWMDGWMLVSRASTQR